MAVVTSNPDCKSGISAGELWYLIRFLFAQSICQTDSQKAAKVQGFATLG